jgi:hypothetical protein
LDYEVQSLAANFGRVDSIECTKCEYRWKVRKSSATEPPIIEKEETIEIIETGRSEEFIGDERRTIDNSGSSSPLSRSLTFSKEKSRSYKIELEKARSSGGGLGISMPEIGSLKLNCERKISEAYSLSQESKETCTEEITCNVGPKTRLTIIVRWKRIWQNGIARRTTAERTTDIPFTVSVGLTFDQQQLEELA